MIVVELVSSIRISTASIDPPPVLLVAPRNLSSVFAVTTAAIVAVTLVATPDIEIDPRWIDLIRVQLDSTTSKLSSFAARAKVQTPLDSAELAGAQLLTGVSK